MSSSASRLYLYTDFAASQSAGQVPKQPGNEHCQRSAPQDPHIEPYQRSQLVTACTLAKSPKATLYTEGFNRFAFTLPARWRSPPIATGWSDQLPGGNRAH